MADVRPFPAVRYNTVRFGRDLTQLVCPPYDVIPQVEQAALYDRHPNNMIRLELTRREPTDYSDDDRYVRAAQWFAEWQRAGVLVADEAPGLYAYEQRFLLNGVSQQRRGLLAALRVEPWERRVVLPHERTLAGPKRDRLELMRACHANLSPIWGMYAGVPDATRELWASLDGREPDEEARDRDGVEHRVWAVSDAGVLARFHEAMTESPVYIADGHHRYETARHFEEEFCGSNPCSADAAAHFTLAYLVDVDDPGLIVLGTHRLIRSPRSLDAEEVRRTLEQWFELTPGPAGAALLDEGGTHPRPALCVLAPRLELAAVARFVRTLCPKSSPRIAPPHGADWIWRRFIRWQSTDSFPRAPLSFPNLGPCSTLGPSRRLSRRPAAAKQTSFSLCVIRRYGK